jgi:hypothetical protein
VLATARALLDNPRLRVPAKPPLELESSSAYSSDAEDPYNIPLDMYETTFLDEFTYYNSIEDAYKALQK